MKEDCYWYDEDRDMGARIPLCKKQKGITPLSDKDCEDCKNYHSRYKQTNADRIRAMTDEELAEFMTDDFCELLCPGVYLCNGKCNKRMLEWLKEEAE